MAKKKNAVLKLLGIGLGMSGGFFLANIAGSAYTYKKNMKKIKEHENENNLMHSLLFGMETVGINQDTNNVFLNCQCGSMTIEMKELPINQDVYINISAAFSKVKVKLPVGVNIIHEGRGLFGKVDSVAASYEEDMPTVHIVRNNTIATKVMVNIVDPDEDADEDIEELDELDELDSDEEII